MKRIVAAMAALASAVIMLLSLAAAERLDNYVGGRYIGEDPWGNPLTIQIMAIEDGKLAWTYTEDFLGQVLTQTFEDTALDGEMAAFHVEGAIQGDETITCDYTGILVLKDGAVILAYDAGEMTEASPNGGSTAYHVAALAEDGRTVILSAQDEMEPPSM